MSPTLLPTPLVSVTWLAEHLHDPHVRVVDASMYLPNAGRDARAEYDAAHIPGAVFADLGWLSDASAPFPHTLLGANEFSERIGALGIGNDDAVVVYDSSGQNFSAPRLWFMLGAYGHRQVAVLDGGLRAWQADGQLVTAASSTTTPRAFTARLQAVRLHDMADMRANLVTRTSQVVDARSPGRFAAREPEPRPGVRGGHIPGSVNVHYATLVTANGTLRAPEELQALFAAAGIDTTRPIVASCGTGITACAVVLALEAIGVHTSAVFDGSWTEWGSTPDAPVATGTD